MPNIKINAKYDLSAIIKSCKELGGNEFEISTAIVGQLNNGMTIECDTIEELNKFVQLMVDGKPKPLAEIPTEQDICVVNLRTNGYGQLVSNAITQSPSAL